MRGSDQCGERAGLGAMRAGWADARGRPSFARPFKGRADQPLTPGRRAWLARARARLDEDLACCDEDCLGELLGRPGFRRSVRAWQAAWSRLPTYDRQAALMEYFRATGSRPNLPKKAFRENWIRH